MLFDLIIILIFLSSVTHGWYRGGIRAIFSFLTYLISFVIAFSCRNLLATIFLNMPLGKEIGDWVSNSMGTVFDEASKLPFISSGIADGAENITYFILQVISILIIFLIVAIILSFIAKILTKIIKIIKLGFLNKILGGIIGAIKGYILIYIIALVCFVLAGWWPWLAKSMVGSYLANNLQNPITLFTNIWRLFI